MSHSNNFQEQDIDMPMQDEDWNIDSFAPLPAQLSDEAELVAVFGSLAIEPSGGAAALNPFTTCPFCYQFNAGWGHNCAQTWDELAEKIKTTNLGGWYLQP